MPTYIYLHRSPAIRLWGLTYSQRIQRQFQNNPNIIVVEQLEQVPAAAKLVVIDGSWLVDGRILQFLANSEAARYYDHQPDRTLAIVSTGDQAAAAIQCLERHAEAPSAELQQLPLRDIKQQISVVESRLRKIDPPLIMKLNASNRRQIEAALYGSAYKSVTDLVTKWLWPHPARVVTRWCAYAGIRPNHVTTLGVLLMLLAGWLFFQGEYGWGLLSGWLMTFLDTVDGKLARVTLTSSKLGNALDHGVDLVHPPFWYVLWGMGLISAHSAHPLIHPALSLDIVFALIFGGYIAGRLAEGCFEWLLASFSIFTWRPFDSFNRLITARRNPCMIILTSSWAAGAATTGLYLVTFWTLFSSLVLWLRNAYALWQRRHGPLQSWLVQAGQGVPFSALAMRTFAPHAKSRRTTQPDA